MKWTSWAPGTALLVVVAFLAARAPELIGGYMAAYLLTLNCALGGLAIMLVAKLSGAHWVDWLMLPLRAAAATLPVFLVLSLPLLLHFESVFSWVNEMPGRVPSPSQRWMQFPWLMLRSVMIPLSWCVVAAAIGMWPLHKALVFPPSRVVLGLITLVITITIFAIDWVMSLVPHNVTTMIGFILISEQWVAALALGTVWLACQRSFATASGRDVGNLLLAAVLFLAYCLFMDYLIVWEANLPHEISAYQQRDGTLMTLIVPVLFVAPVGLLLFRYIKTSTAWLGAVGGLVFLGHILIVTWLVSPLVAIDHAAADIAVTTAFVAGWLLLFVAVCRYLDFVTGEVHGRTS